MQITERRGSLIVFEGVAWTGKTAQAKSLVNFLAGKGIKAQYMDLPDMSLASGKDILAYMRNEKALTDEEIFQLTAENRGSSAGKIKYLMRAGITVVVEHYSYCGIVHATATGDPKLTYEHCCAVEHALPVPDLVIYMYPGQKGMSRYNEVKTTNSQSGNNYIGRALALYAHLHGRDSPWVTINNDQEVDLNNTLIRDVSLQVCEAEKSKDIYDIFW